MNEELYKTNLNLQNDIEKLELELENINEEINSLF